jgi:glyoxylase-like metal-dependent hydrolase (beta-lactamase superfamily II)
MVKLMEIADGVYVIECPHRTYFVSSCLFVGDTLTLVDAGRRESPEEAIYPYIRELGRDPSEISQVILTHAHWDHCAGAAKIKTHTDCKIRVHRLGKPFLEDPSLVVRQLAERFPSQASDHMANFEPIEVDMPFDDGDLIDLGTKKLEVIHIPGHSADSTCIADKELGIYICGDSMQGQGMPQPLIFHSLAEYTASAKRLLNKSIKILVNGHPFLPFKKGILRGDECSEHISESLKEILKIRNIVLDTLRSTGRPMSLIEICERMDATRPITIGCILEALDKDGEADKITRNENVLWHAKLHK